MATIPDTSPNQPALRIVAADPREELAVGADVELDDLLSAWHAATLRLEETHTLLQHEVRRLTDELEIKNAELARKNRLADLGQVASHIAHEVKNGLVPITLYLNLLRRRLQSDLQGLDILQKVEAGFTALNATVNDLLSFAAHRPPNWQTFVVDSMLEELVESLAPQFEAQAVDVEVDAPPQTLLSADREMIRRAVLNMVLNALDVMPRGGELVITLIESHRGVEIEVADTGPGIGPDQRKQLFEPFFSTKESGTGLGLAMVQRVAEAHGGAVDVCDCPDGGAAFTLFIPRMTTTKAAA